mmetsp:Transcript_11633/g.24556  ORF Transcript_11633/g.24556 Transcript_11633/m.24556 type:complete len:100 (+) Transcript_11633:248-547(+)
MFASPRFLIHVQRPNLNLNPSSSSSSSSSSYRSHGIFSSVKRGISDIIWSRRCSSPVHCVCYKNQQRQQQRPQQQQQQQQYPTNRKERTNTKDLNHHQK